MPILTSGTIKFKIRSKQSNLWLWVYVHPTLKKFIQAYKKYEKREFGQDNPTIEDVKGCCHCYRRIRINEDKTEEASNEVGIIRLAFTNCTPLVIAHELVHGAMQIYREEFQHSATFGSNCGPKEENLAYIYGELFRDINIKLHRYNIWT